MPYPTPFKICLAILLSLSALFTACRKEKYTYAEKIEGTYNFHHTFYAERAGTPPVFTTYPDVTFEITKKNKKQVAIDGQTLNLESMNDYTVIYRNGKPESTTHTLYYNKTTGTLSYYVSGHAGAGGNSYDSYTSY